MHKYIFTVWAALFWTPCNIALPMLPDIPSHVKWPDYWRDHFVQVSCEVGWPLLLKYKSFHRKIQRIRSRDENYNATKLWWRYLGDICFIRRCVWDSDRTYLSSKTTWVYYNQCQHTVYPKLIVLLNRYVLYLYAHTHIYIYIVDDSRKNMYVIQMHLQSTMI